jgi:hypothetical protein
MNTHLDCIPCFFKQALFAARASTQDDRKIKQVLDKVARRVPRIPLGHPPPETGKWVYSVVRDITGVADPFKSYKGRSIQKALSLYGELKSRVDRAQDPLRTAVQMAIAGNVIDLGANPNVDPEKEMRNLLEGEVPEGPYQRFKKRLRKARTVLLLADNAGESVLDRLLIETMGKETVYAVRNIPIINDATIEDAERSGIGQVARIVSSGYDGPGTILKGCSKEFLSVYAAADLIVSKGQGNFESLSAEDAPIFFMLKVKCPVIAGHLGAAIGDPILRPSHDPNHKLPGGKLFDPRQGT